MHVTPKVLRIPWKAAHELKYQVRVSDSSEAWTNLMIDFVDNACTGSRMTRMHRHLPNNGFNPVFTYVHTA